MIFICWTPPCVSLLVLLLRSVCWEMRIAWNFNCFFNSQQTKGCRVIITPAPKEKETKLASALCIRVSAEWSLLRYQFEISRMAWENLSTVSSASETIKIHDKLLLFGLVSHQLLFESVEISRLLWALSQKSFKFGDWLALPKAHIFNSPAPLGYLQK